MIQFIITGPIPPKKNIIKFGNGRFYRPDSFYQFQKNAILEIQSQVKQTIVPKKVILNFTLIRDKDWDNVAGMVSDLLEAAGVIKNDKEIKDVHVTKTKGTKEFCEVIIYD